MFVVHSFLVRMKDLGELKAEYMTALERIRRRREALQRLLPLASKGAREIMQKRIAGLYTAEENLLEGIRGIARDL